MKRLITMLACAGLLLSAGAALAQRASFKVVVNASSSTSSLSRATASKLFLKKKTRWESGGKVLPVDQVKKSSVRESFSEAVHNKDVRAIESYWQTQIFGGRATPPPELVSDTEILDYVRTHAGAIGYVSRNATLGEGVKAVEITD